MMQAMSNVVTLKPRGSEGFRTEPAVVGRETAALVSDLVDIVAGLKAASGRASMLSRPALEVEQTVQLLLDAMTSVERAAETLTDNGEYLPF
jgi:hypothetical protein